MRHCGVVLLGIWAANVVPALAQTTKETDVAGVWHGKVALTSVTGQKWDSVPGKPRAMGKFVGNLYEVKQGISWLVLRPDNLWWEWTSADGQGREWGTSSGGRWRVSGDSLWLGEAPSAPGYFAWITAQLQNVQHLDSVTADRLAGLDVLHDTAGTDTLRKKARAKDVQWGRRIYKITSKDQQLSLIPLSQVSADSLARNPEAIPVGIPAGAYEQQKR